MQNPDQTSLVEPSWLAQRLGDDHVVLLDASFKLPGVTPTAAQHFAERHIPTAQFFDVDQVADRANPLPHMLPTAEQFAGIVGDMGIANDTMVVVYDGPGLMSAGRAWWMFRAFGHRNVAILNGGMRAWQSEGRPVTAELSRRSPRAYQAQLDPAVVADKAGVLENIASRRFSLIDARSEARFTAREKEARPGLRSGHVPGSLNLPFTAMTDPATGKMKSTGDLRQAFAGAGLDFGRPVIASCGSGVTACALVFGLHLLGKDDVAVYDGAWAEWGMPGNTPVEP